ncbi:MAG: hypothetical protein HQK79_20440 [Desulfobacterales bacterium]|nr:hypothetical protein [Desulfobacterales bacterium]
MIQIRKKDGSVKLYETVAERLKKFREKFPIETGWKIITEITFPSDREKVVFCIAKIISPLNDIISTGHAEEIRDSSLINQTSAVENCETSAIGRALFSAGFGGGEFFCSAEEIALAEKKQADLKTQEKPSETSNTKEPKPSDQPNQQTKIVNKKDFGIPADVEVDVVIKDDNKVVIIEKVKGSSYKHRGLIKNAGFHFDGKTKEWIKEIA